MKLGYTIVLRLTPEEHRRLLRAYDYYLRHVAPIPVDATLMEKLTEPQTLKGDTQS